MLTIQYLVVMEKTHLELLDEGFDLLEKKIDIIKQLQGTQGRKEADLQKELREIEGLIELNKSQRKGE